MVQQRVVQPILEHRKRLVLLAGSLFVDVPERSIQAQVFLLVGLALGEVDRRLRRSRTRTSKCRRPSARCCLSRTTWTILP